MYPEDKKRHFSLFFFFTFYFRLSFLFYFSFYLEVVKDSISAAKQWRSPFETKADPTRRTNLLPITACFQGSSERTSHKPPTSTDDHYKTRLQIQTATINHYSPIQPTTMLLSRDSHQWKYLRKWPELSLHAKKKPDKHCPMTSAGPHHDGGFSQLM